MTDVSVYEGEGDPETYMRLSKSVEFYTKSTETVIDIAQKYITRESVIADFCCGTGETTKKVAERNGKIKEAVLIDITPAFLKEAKNSNIPADKINTIEGGHSQSKTSERKM